MAAHKTLENGFGNISSYDRKLQRDYVGSLVSGYNMQDREKDGLLLLRDFFQQIRQTEAPSADLSIKDKAFFLNQFQRLLHGSKNYKEALEIANEVLQLSPEDTTYNYNLSIIYEDMNDMESSYRIAKKLYNLAKADNKYDDDHLRRIVKLFAKFADPLVKEAFLKLEEVNHYKAAMLLRDKDVRKAVQG